MSKQSNRLTFLRNFLDMEKDQMSAAIEGLDEAVPTSESDGVALFCLITAAKAIQQLKFGM